MIGRAIEAAKASPIVEVIGRYVTLGKSGRSFSACCPFHDDRSPSLHVYPDSGRFYCFGCEAKGDVIDFVRRYEGCGFLDAINLIGNFDHSACPPSKVPKVSKGKSDHRRYASTLWSNAGPIAGTLGEDYLANRGIVLGNLQHPPPLRFDYLKSSKTGLTHPAILSLIEDPTQAFAGIQRTFLTDGGRKHPAAGKTTLGELSGNATRLSPSCREVVLCEGLEDGLTLQLELPNIAVWVTAGTSNLSKILIPADCQKVVIAADNDNAGSKAADDAAKAYLRQGYDARIIHPDHQFKDFNEQYQKAITA